MGADHTGFEHDAIRALLPHGHPMVLIDRVVDLDPGRSLTALKAVTGSEPCYAQLDHPDGPEAFAYPVSLQLESLGQAAALLWLLTAEATGRQIDGVLMLASARDYEVSGRALPGDVLRHEVQVDHVMDGAGLVVGETWVGGRRIAAARSIFGASRPAAALAKETT